MTHHLCIPSDVFELIVRHAKGPLEVTADAEKKYAVIDGIEYSAPLADLDGAA